MWRGSVVIVLLCGLFLHATDARPHHQPHHKHHSHHQHHVGVGVGVGVGAPTCVFNVTLPDRLPAAVMWPTHYGLNLTLPNPNTPDVHSFTGAIDITIQVAQLTTCVILHSFGPTIHEATFATGTPPIVKSTAAVITYDAVKQWVIINFPGINPEHGDTLPLGTAVVHLTFTSPINNQSAFGFFLSDNTNAQPLSSHEATMIHHAWTHKTQHEIRDITRRVMTTDSPLKMFATQFEATFARQAWPCFDEPALKATWQSTIAIPSQASLTALFNTDNISTITAGGYDITTFNITKHPLPSYLIAVAVGTFEYAEAIRDEVRFRIYGPPGSKSQAAFALSLSMDVVDYFGSSWLLKYKEMNTKMDQIAVAAIDGDAMENQGLLTYSPFMLLVNNNTAALPATQLVAMVTTHEIAHQWFGDTITMPYWSSEFLNEGYARYLQYVGVSQFHPQWNLWETTDTSMLGWPMTNSLKEDAAGFGIAIVVNETQEANSDIFYQKGAVINRMFSTYFGASQWNAIHAYHLNNHSWANPNVYDLATSYSLVTNRPEVYNGVLSWLLQPHVPVIRLSYDPIWSEITVTQTPLCRYVTPQPVWWIPGVPLTIDTYSSTIGTFIEFATSSVIISNISSPSSNVSMIANEEMTHYVIPTYDNWEYVIDHYTNISSFHTQRTQILITQSSLLVWHGHEHIDTLISFTQSLKKPILNFLRKQNYHDIYTLSHVLITEWSRLLLPLRRERSQIYYVASQALNEIGTEIMQSLKWDVKVWNNADISQICGLWYSLLVELGNHDAITNGTAIFMESGTGTPDPSIQLAVYMAATVSSTSNSKLLTSLYQLYHNTLHNETLKSQHTNIVTALMTSLTGYDTWSNAQSLLQQTEHDATIVLQAMSTTLSHQINDAIRMDAWSIFMQYTYQITSSSIVVSHIPSQSFSTAQDFDFITTWIQSLHGWLTSEQREMIRRPVQINMDFIANN